MAPPFGHGILVLPQAPGNEYAFRIALRFGSDLACLIETHRRRSTSYVEDLSIEDRSKMA